MGISVTEGLCIFLLSLPTVSAFQSDLTDRQESQKSKTLTDFMKISVWEENIQQIRKVLVEPTHICAPEAGTGTK